MPCDSKTAIEIPCVCKNPDLLPIYASDGAAGADVRAAIDDVAVIEPGQSLLVPTGIHCALPEGYEIQVRPRSGLAFKNQITVLNTPGTIDSDYRGEIGVILINHGKNAFEVTPGMRIAQLVVAPVTLGQFTIVGERLTATNRGAGGFGHSGLH